MRNFQHPGRSPVHAPEGMAATSHPLSTQVAIDVLKTGGNALDAAIAACAVQCVVEPQSTGIAGDCFCLYAPEGRTNIVSFNGSGKAPSGATAEFFTNAGITNIERPSVHSVVVPGAIDAWCTLNKDHGRMPLEELLVPAINYARDGYPVAPRVQREFVLQKDFLLHDNNATRVFFPDGQTPAVGARHRQPELAETLARVAKGGRDAFYKGEVAEDIVGHLKSLGGLHTLADFAAASGDYVEPISTNYRGRTVYECPPNGQGLIALLLMNIMDGFSTDRDPLSLERIHQEIEACRQAYHARTRYLADPEFSAVPIQELLSDVYAEQLRGNINADHATIPSHHIELPKHEDTVYISVVDKDRNACSFINTLFWPFGSGIMSPNTGVLLTNRAEGFVLDSSSPNCIAPGKRPLHTIIPGMVAENDRIILSFGVMGGEYQSMGHMQFLTRYFDFGMDIQEAQDAPRFMANPFTGDVEIEEGVPESIREGLTAMGHNVEVVESPIGGSQAISIDWTENILTAGSDPRKDGCAIGY